MSKRKTGQGLFKGLDIALMAVVGVFALILFSGSILLMWLVNSL